MPINNKCVFLEIGFTAFRRDDGSCMRELPMYVKEEDLKKLYAEEGDFGKLALDAFIRDIEEKLSDRLRKQKNNNQEKDNDK